MTVPKSTSTFVDGGGAEVAEFSEPKNVVADDDGGAGPVIAAVVKPKSGSGITVFCATEKGCNRAR